MSTTASNEVLIDGLTDLQADGLACVVCSTSYLHVRVAHVPVGRSDTGSQVFACAGQCAMDANRSSTVAGDAR